MERMRQPYLKLVKSFFIITIIILLLCLLCSCTSVSNVLKAKISPADESLIELTSKIYEDSQLTQITQFNGQISELDVKFPIECLRKYNEIYRVAYLGVEKVAILVFDDSGNKILGNIYNVQKLKSDFGGLEKGQSLEDVQKIDPHGEYLFLYTGRNDTPKVSSHYTKDGYLITIEYDDTGTIMSIMEELI